MSPRGLRGNRTRARSLSTGGADIYCPLRAPPRTPGLSGSSARPLTLHGVVHLLDEQLQLHHQGGCVAVRLPGRRFLGASPEGRIDPLLHVEVFRQELGEVHGCTVAARRPSLKTWLRTATRLQKRVALREHPRQPGKQRPGIDSAGDRPLHSPWVSALMCTPGIDSRRAPYFFRK
ncbi:hypothetical protein JEQ12_012425 [Ovis aries]|uniref:Uncharacterized protein n=1 Tax=Ovis aries TaxID=9940 RepID=A0A835ZMF5_SHEEP|nr:hypothetical protein JEQ12_012425 [Ovis aries]